MSEHDPAHVVVRLQRRAALAAAGGWRFGVLRGCFRKGKERFGFRLVHYSVQREHLHLMVEAEDARALSRGMQGLCVRVAKALNKLWGRRGRVFDDRYFARRLRLADRGAAGAALRADERGQARRDATGVARPLLVGRVVRRVGAREVAARAPLRSAAGSELPCSSRLLAPRRWVA